MAEPVSLRDAAKQALGYVALDLLLNPNNTKSAKVDKEAWRGEDEEDDEEQFFAKPINLSI